MDKQVARLNVAGRIEEMGVKNKREPVGGRRRNWEVKFGRKCLCICEGKGQLGLKNRRDVLWGRKGAIIHYEKKGKHLRKVCTEECNVFLLSLASVASDTHTHTHTMVFMGGITG